MDVLISEPIQTIYTIEDEDSETKKNNIPVAIINIEEIVLVGTPVTFIGDSSFDPDGDTLMHIWYFGNGDGLVGENTEYTYLISGEYTVSLTVSDNEFSSVEERVVTIVETIEELPLSINEIIEQKKIYISEFIPNPKGFDNEGEWIEIYNDTFQIVDLTDWYIDDGMGGSKPYQLPIGSTIDKKSWLILDREETKIALNNSVDSVRLLSPDNLLVDEVAYKNPIEGYSYAKLDNKFIWTSNFTPGEVNSNDLEKNPNTTTGTDVISINDIHLLTRESVITTRGIVTVTPHLFAKTYAYITSDVPDSSELIRGIKITLANSIWPSLHIGDFIEVKGIYSTTGNEPKIKVDTDSNILILSSGEVSIPTNITIRDINNSMIGSLITVEGQIIETTGQNIYIDDDTSEIRVYIYPNTNIDKSLLREGDFVSISGILSNTSSGLRLLPSTASDIVKTEILGEVFIPEENVALDQSRSSAFKYITATILFLGITLIIVSLKIKKKKKEIESISLEN